MFTRRGFGAAALGGFLGLSPRFARGQDFTSRPVHLLIPFSAGGGVDAVLRRISAKVNEMSGVQIVIENRPGGGGVVAANAAKAAAPDGFTILEVDIGTFITHPSLAENSPFDPVADFEPICEIYNSRSALYVPANSPAKSVRDIVERAKQNPGTVTYCSQGKGSIGHILGTKFEQVTGVKLVHVPYRGSAPALTDLIAGRIDMMLNNYASFAGAYTSGQLRALGVISPVPMSVFAGVPTMAEAGYPAMEFQSWFGLVAPRGTPEPAIRKLNELFVKASTHPDIEKWLNEQGLTVSTSAPAAFKQLIRDESVRMKQFVIANNMR